MNTKFHNLLVNVKTRIYKNLPEYWKIKHKEYKKNQIIMFIVILCSIPLAYISGFHWNSFPLFFISALISGFSTIGFFIHFFSLSDYVHSKKALENNFTDNELYDFSEKKLLCYFNKTPSAKMQNFNSELSKEELQQLLDVVFNNKQLQYLYELLKNKQSITLSHLLSLEALEEVTIERYKHIFNEFANENGLNSNHLNMNMNNTKLETQEEKKETYYEKYL